jgi:hypothetical protein
MRLIDADRAILALNEVGTKYKEEGDLIREKIVDIIIKILWDEKSTPTIEAEPVVHAHWEVRGGVPYCSACGGMLNGYSCDNDVSTTPRCSFCGAKMYGGAS